MRKLSKLIAVVILVLGLATSLFAADPAGAPEKVHPWVWAHTENGASAEFIVVLKAQADVSPAYELGNKQDRGNFVYNALYNVAEWHQTAIRAWLESKKAEFRPFYIVNALWVKGDRQLVLELAAWDDVERIEGNPVIQNELPKPDPLDSMVPEIPQAIEWNITKTQAPGVWALGFTGQGIVVGGQDTGYRWTHNAIKGKYRGWDGVIGSHDYNWHDSIHSGGGICGANATQPCDDDGHGTHTMGTVLGDDGGSNQIGMAPGAKWIGCRDMDQGAGTPATYLECFEFFLAPYPVGGSPAQGDPTKAPDVTSNSWGCPPSEGCSALSLEAAVNAQKAAGIMTVAAAGNSGSACNTVDDPPAIYGSSYTIGSTTASDALSSFSSRGTAATTNLMKPDIVAPGSGVRSSTNTSDSSYTTLSGTSMATPNVAGGVALVWSARACYKNDQDLTAALLGANATRLTAIVEGCGGNYVNGPNNSWGYGLMNVLAAVNNAAAGPVAPTGVGSSVPGPNQIDVTWNLVGGAIGYEVYRSNGACPGSTFVLIGSIAGPPYLDTTVSGGLTYSYKVKTVDSICTSPYSTCTAQTATGVCTAAPNFAGLTSVTNPGSATCTLNLAWSAGSSNCAAALTYSIYRSTVSGFVPAPANRIAIGVSGTTYSDTVGIAGGTTYYYVVHAVDSGNGSEDANVVERNGVPSGPFTNGTWSDDAGDTGAAKLILTAPWIVAVSGGRTLPRVYQTGAYTDNLCAALTTPTLLLGTSAVLSFASKYDIETDWDAGIVEIATSPTYTNWTKLPVTTYPNDLANAGNACGFPASGPNTVFSLNIAAPAYPALYTSALAAYNGQLVKLRWNFSSDTSVTRAGWWIDDISITNVQVPGSCAIGAPGSADLGVVKSDSPDPVAGGGTLTYTVTATNAGPDNATGVTVIDTLPAGVAFVSATPSQGSCSQAGGVVTCTLGAILNGGSATIVIVVTAPAAGPLSNSVSISGTESDPNPANDNDTEATTVTVVSADLGVVKTDSPDPVAAGGTLTYTVTATNAGPDNATGVTVTDTLPAGVGFVSAMPTQGSCSQAGGVVTCIVGALANGGSATIVIVVTAPAAGPLSNSVSISGTEADPNPANDNDTEATTVTLASADLGVVKTDSPDPVAAGGTLTYTVTATNAGPDNATGVTVIDTLPAGVAFVSATPSQGSCSQAGGVVTCTLGAISNGGSATMTIVVTAPAAGPLSNSVSVSGTESDPNPANDNDTEATTVTLASADLGVVKTDSPDPVAAGGTLTYTVTATNAGPDNATGVTVVDALPAGVIFVTATPSQGVCSEAGGIVTCGLGAILNGGSVTIAIVVGAPAAGPCAGALSNSVSISGAEADPNPANNDDTEATTVSGDTVPPVVTPPASTTVDATICVGNLPGATGNSSAPLAAFIAGGSATDNCDTTPTQLPSQVAGADIDDSTFFPIGTTTVTFRFQDDAGNIGSAIADVTVDVFYGDLNEDNLINAGDSVILANFLVGNLAQGVPPFTAPLAAADLNNAGGVNSVDSVILANFLVGNITCLPQ